MRYSDGRPPVDVSGFIPEFYAEHGEITAMSEDQFGTLINTANERYESLPYHGFAHPMQVMRDAAELICKLRLKIPADQRLGLFVATAYHDAGEGYPAEQREFKSPEEFSFDLLQKDSGDFVLDQRTLDIARVCILATSPGDLSHKSIESRVIVRSDVANVLAGDTERMAGSTRLLVDECMLKTHQDHDDFKIETFITNTTLALLSYLNRDLFLSARDEWAEARAVAVSAVNSQIPYIARNHFAEKTRILGRNLQDGVYPYSISQGSSSVVTPVPIRDLPGPSTTS